MTPLQSLFFGVLDEAIGELKREKVPVYTFAFYHDHESAAVSVCADTNESSARCVHSSNRYGMKYFAEAIRKGDLEAAGRWQANVGRSLSLGDFARVNLARRDLGRAKVTAKFHLTMIQCVVERQARIVKLAPEPLDLLFTCSTADDEVGVVWAALGRKS